MLLAIPVLVGGLLVMAALVLLWRSFCEFYVAIFRISEDLPVLRADVEAERKRVGGRGRPNAGVARRARPASHFVEGGGLAAGGLPWRRRRRASSATCSYFFCSSKAWASASRAPRLLDLDGVDLGLDGGLASRRPSG